MVAPNRELFNLGHRLAGLGGNLAGGAVMVQPQHGGEILARQVGGAFHGDVGIGIGRIADDKHLDIAAGNGIKRLALRREYGAIDGQQLRALHARAARTRTHQQRVIGILERGHRIAVRLHADEQRKGAIVKLHHHAFQRFLRTFHGYFEQLQNYRLILAEHFARSDAKQQCVANLAGGTGDSNANGFFAHGKQLQES